MYVEYVVQCPKSFRPSIAYRDGKLLDLHVPKRQKLVTVFQLNRPSDGNVVNMGFGHTSKHLSENKRPTRAQDDVT